MRFIESWFFYMRRGCNLLGAAALLTTVIVMLSFGVTSRAEMVDRIVAVVNAEIIGLPKQVADIKIALFGTNCIRRIQQGNVEGRILRAWKRIHAHWKDC